MAKLLIYGASGYTGTLISNYAKRLGLEIILAGRSKSKLEKLASTLQVPFRVFAVDDPPLVDASLQGASVLLNCAGPFKRTAEPLINACIRTRVHYLDIAAELDSYRLAEEHDDEARRAGTLLLPGCGGSVAMLGCLAGRAAERVTAAQPPARIDIALHVAGPVSRGSAVSAAENLFARCLQRREGALVEQDAGAAMQFDFGDGRGDVACSPATLPDLVTLWRSTGARNIRTFVHVSGDAFAEGRLEDLPDGPTAEQRAANPYHVAAVVAGTDGAVTGEVLHTKNGYSFTSVAAVQAARRVMAGVACGGFQTPAGLFGNDFTRCVDEEDVV